MAFRSKPIAVGTSDTDIFVMGVALQGALILALGNQTGGALTYTLKFYKASTAATTTLITSKSLAANDFFKVPTPFLMETGDKVIMSASLAGIVAFCSVTDKASNPVAKGWNPRGPYSAIATYAANDVVDFTNGNSYISRVDGNVGNDPSTSPIQWMVNALKGAPGDYAPGGTDVAIADGGTGASDAATALSNLGAVPKAGGVTMTGGVSVQSPALGTVTSGTVTPVAANGNIQHMTANGAFTLAPPATVCCIDIEVTNGSAAGTITTSGFTKVNGDPYVTTNGFKFFFHIEKTQNYSRLSIEALQ